jgi:hypothetical protein
MPVTRHKQLAFIALSSSPRECLIAIHTDILFVKTARQETQGSRGGRYEDATGTSVDLDHSKMKTCRQWFSIIWYYMPVL